VTLFAVKFVHSLVFGIVSLAIVYVWYAILTGMSGPLLTLAVAVILLESAIYIGNGLCCPLTHLAQQHGDTRGDDFVADIFLPAWFVPLVPYVCGSLAFLGLFVLLARTLLG